mmetsp:Transcript_31127/g.81061  ORF Transcript_31127/g.81061 Transcript_31127/m.81061 type:complete len:167 (-) Transcript_31127:1453-1953(-)
MRTHQKQAQQSTHSSMSYHSQQGQAPQAPPVPRHHNNSLVSLSASTHLYACTLGKPHSPLLLLLLLLPLPLLLRTGPGLGETRSSLLTVIVPSLCWTTAFTLLSLFALAGLPRVLLLALLLALLLLLTLPLRLPLLPQLLLLLPLLLPFLLLLLSLFECSEGRYCR